MVSAVLATAVGLWTAGASVLDFWPLGVASEVPDVEGPAVAGVRGAPVLVGAATAAELLLAVVGIGLACAPVGVVLPRWVSDAEPAESAGAVVSDVGVEGDVVGSAGAAVEEPPGLVAVTGFRRPLFRAGAVPVLPEFVPVAVGAAACPGSLSVGESLGRCPGLSCPLDPASPLLLPVGPLEDADDFDPAAVPSSADATATPLTSAAPIPRATAPVPSHR